MGDIVDGETIVDAALQYAQHIPVNVIARMLGFPVEDDDLFREFVHDTLENVNHSPEERIAGFDRLDAYIDVQIEAHQADAVPRDDLTTYLLDVELEGQKLSLDHVRGSIVLLLLAGIDTTWSAIGSSLWHLAGHPDDRRRLVDEPELMPVAIEEFLRAYAPVTMARLVAKDHDFHGCPMKADDWVLLPFPAANRDPAEFPDADEVIVDRLENRHAAFGLGIHRCLGSNLARLEVRVAVEEFLARFPDFELADRDAVRWSVGQIRGPAPVAGTDPRRRLSARSGRASPRRHHRADVGRGADRDRHPPEPLLRGELGLGPLVLGQDERAAGDGPSRRSARQPSGHRESAAARISTTPAPNSITPSSGVWSKVKTSTTGSVIEPASPASAMAPIPNTNEAMPASRMSTCPHVNRRFVDSGATASVGAVVTTGAGAERARHLVVVASRVPSSRIWRGSSGPGCSASWSSVRSRCSSTMSSLRTAREEHFPVPRRQTAPQTVPYTRLLPCLATLSPWPMPLPPPCSSPRTTAPSGSRSPVPSSSRATRW